jgi:hypothetical protein
MQITKVKLIKGGDAVELTVIRLDDNKKPFKCDEEHPSPVHVDFKAAMKGLAIHFAILTDYVKPKQVKDINKYDVDLIAGFEVTSYSIKGDSEDKGITLTGYKRKDNGKCVIKVI